MTKPSPLHPEAFRRRILLAVTGMSPQIVTESLYTLRFTITCKLAESAAAASWP